MNHDALYDYLASGGRLGAPENAPARYRGEIMRLMAIFVDSEAAGAAGFADSINMAPGIRERIVASRIVLEKFQHAARVLRLMREFGADTERYMAQHPWSRRQGRSARLGIRRIDGDLRLNVFHYPITDWCDAVTMNMLMGIATVVQLDDLADCSYQPLRDALDDILPAETRHAALGAAGVARLLDQGHDPSSVQASVDYWYPRVADAFGRTDSGRFELYRRMGLRRHDNDHLKGVWRTQAQQRLAALSLATPE